MIGLGRDLKISFLRITAFTLYPDFCFDLFCIRMVVSINVLLYMDLFDVVLKFKFELCVIAPSFSPHFSSKANGLSSLFSLPCKI